jgi:hypothetical protein
MSAMQASLLCLYTSHAKYGQCIHPTSIQISFKVHHNKAMIKIAHEVDGLLQIEGLILKLNFLQ